MVGGGYLSRLSARSLGVEGKDVRDRPTDKVSLRGDIVSHSRLATGIVRVSLRLCQHSPPVTDKVSLRRWESEFRGWDLRFGSVPRRARI